MTEITRRDLGLGLAGLGIAAALPARAAATHAVSISNFKFDPADLSVAAGDTVTFTNADGLEFQRNSKDTTSPMIPHLRYAR
jgi:plastocyanin